MTNLVAPLRCFFAIALTQANQDALVAIIAQLKKTYRPLPINWTPKNNLHITLQFIKQIAAEDLPKLITHLRPALTALKPFQLTLGPVELFPTPYQAKILSVTLGPTDKLAELAHTVGLSISHFGYPVEARPYRGHITLGRMQKQLPAEKFHFSEIDISQLEPFTLQEIILFHSQPSATGSHYTTLERLGLGNKS